MANHTAVPWRVETVTGIVSTSFIFGADNRLIAKFDLFAEDAANAEHIVLCVNTHTALVKALTMAQQWIESELTYQDERNSDKDENEDNSMLDTIEEVLAAAKQPNQQGE